jgi:glycerol-3-phosphate cytidylyltransferase-like family protein
MTNRLDIRIKNLKDIRLDDEEIEKIFDNPLICTEKIDGIKINLVMTREGPIVTYKGEILTESEFSGIDVEKAKKESIGHSQLIFARKLALEFSKTASSNTEYFFEFTLRKPTLSRTYQRVHELFLIGKAKIVSTRAYCGKLFTTTEEMELMHGTPAIEIPEHSSPRTRWNLLLEKCLKRESFLGGEPEGAILETSLGIFKVVQPLQYDREFRKNFRLQWEMEEEKEKKYFEIVKKKSWRIIQILSENLDFKNYEKSLEVLSNFVYKQLLVLDISHEKKSEFQIKEDIFHNCKQTLLRKMKGNNGAMFIGRFQFLTVAHSRILRKMQNTHDTCVVAIVRSKNADLSKNPFPFELQKRAIHMIAPQAIVIEVPTASLFPAMQKAETNINHIYCGEDRFDTYSLQLKNSPEITLHNCTRDEVSGTSLRNAISQRNFESFKELVDDTCVSLYDELIRYIVSK